ncbi:hypothetical protein GL218_09196 [Daldinia childiae]|uniref:uncharacterized protein n=1 Tax=Daldinia childiae TaxID=326645 RepID=UPI0014481F73|nr:uncharacterized protein GL218_09196 [Daldinia childiae]KAF3066410.1 hypothetical protein GL218_09196 [Daldinia childiae]
MDDIYRESRRDYMEDDVATRRRDTIKYCSRITGEPEEKFEGLLEACKSKAAEFLQKHGIGSGVGVDYFQWRADILMWNNMSKLEGAEPCPFLAKKPGLCTEPKSEEYSDLCDLYTGQLIPAAEWEKRRAQALATAPAPSHLAQAESEQVWQTETKANEETGTYVWSQEQADAVWDKVFKGHKKVCNQPSFSVMLPLERSHQKCIVERIGRSNQLVDSRYLHIVWISTRNEHGQFAGFKIVLSPVNRVVDITDILFLHAITVAWNMVWYWLGKILTLGEDVNFATCNEEYLWQTLAKRQDPMAAVERNLASKEYDNLYFKRT